MKKQIKFLLYLLIAVPIFFIGCQKSDVTEDDAQSTKEVSLKNSAFCGTTTTANLYSYGNTTTKYGTVVVGNDAANFYVTYTLEPGWTLLPAGTKYYNGAYLFVGSEATLEAMYFENVVNPDFTGHFNYMLFPNHYTPAASGETTYQFVIPMADIAEECPIVVAFAGITNGATTKVVSARSLLKGSGYWFTHCKQYCTCETAYAFGGDVATCFLDLTGFPLSANNWGWTNEIAGDMAIIHWPVYAAAGQCDITKGTLVGYLDGSCINGVLNLSYTMTAPYTLNITQIYIGATKLPVKNGKWVTAPGQFKGTAPIVDMEVDYPFYIAAHAEVCGPY